MMRYLPFENCVPTADESIDMHCGCQVNILQFKYINRYLE